MALLRSMFPRESFAPEAVAAPALVREGHEWLTLPQAACELGVSVSTVRRLVRKEQLESRPVPRPGERRSLELKDASLDNDLPESWRLSAAEGGTPGR